MYGRGRGINVTHAYLYFLGPVPSQLYECPDKTRRSFLLCGLGLVSEVVIVLEQTSPGHHGLIHPRFGLLEPFESVDTFVDTRLDTVLLGSNLSVSRSNNVYMP